MHLIVALERERVWFFRRWSQSYERVFICRSSQLAGLGWTMGTSQRVYEMVQGSLGRARHQVHRTGSTYTLAKGQSFPRPRVRRGTTLRFQGILFGFRIRNVPRCIPRSFPTPNHALNKRPHSLRLKMLSCLLSKDISPRILDQLHIDEPSPGDSAFHLFFALFLRLAVLFLHRWGAHPLFYFMARLNDIMFIFLTFDNPRIYSALVVRFVAWCRLWQ